MEIRRAKIQSKDAFWNSENVTVYDSEITGEYLGWHSKNLRLVNCTISGTQPLCYAAGLVLENCIMTQDCDLCFEYASLKAGIKGGVASVKIRARFHYRGRLWKYYFRRTYQIAGGLPNHPAQRGK